MADSTKQVSLTNIPTGMRTSFTKAQRRRLIADELMKQSLAQQQRWTIDTGKYLVPDIGAGIGKIGQALMGKQYGDEADAEMQQLMGNAEKQRQAQTAQFLATKFGGQDLGNAPAEGQVGPPRQEDTISKPNPHLAIAQALASDDSAIQAMGQKDYEKLPNPESIMKLIGTGNVDPKSLPGFISNPWDPSQIKPEEKFGVYNGIGVSSQGGKMTGKVPVEQYTAPAKDPVSGLTITTETTKNEPKALYGGNVTSETSWSREAGNKLIDKAATDLESTYQEVQRGKQMLPILAQMPELISGAQTGFAANQILVARRIAEFFGVRGENLDKIVNSQSFIGAVGPSVLTTLKQFGSSNSLTDADREAAKAFTLSDLANDPRAMLKAQGLIFAGILNAAKKHEENFARAQGIKSFPPDLLNYFNVGVSGDESMFERLGVKYIPEQNRYASMLTSGASQKIGAPVTTPIDYSKMSNEELRKILSRGAP